MNPWLQILALTLFAGLAMPAGALLAIREHIHPRWLETELRHTILAFGAGALLAAVALVLVPEGMRTLPVWLGALCFAAGGVLFMLIDRYLAAHRTSASQAVDMLFDYIPETLALGAGAPTVCLALLLIPRNSLYADLLVTGIAACGCFASLALLKRRMGGLGPLERILSPAMNALKKLNLRKE